MLFYIFFQHRLEKSHQMTEIVAVTRLLSVLSICV